MIKHFLFLIFSIISPFLYGGCCNTYIGQDTLGGIVFFVYQDSLGNDHGLITSKTEVKGLNYQNSPSLIGANSLSDGKYNTSLLTNSTLKDYVNSLGSEWYIPAIEELNLLYDNLMVVNMSLKKRGFTSIEYKSSNDSFYISSTEDPEDSAAYYLLFRFYEGFVNKDDKSSSSARKFRAIKQF